MPMTYNDLVNTVKSYLDRTDTGVSEMIQTFVDLSVSNIWRELKDLGLETYSADGLRLIPGRAFLPKPLGWRRTLSFNYGRGATDTTTGNNRVLLKLRSYEFCVSYWPDLSQQGAPIYYCDYGFEAYMIVPTPIVDYQFEIAYIGPPPPINPENQMGWLLTYAPDVLFNRIMMEAVIFLKDYEAIPSWEKKYMESIRSLTYQDNLREDGSGEA